MIERSGRQRCRETNELRQRDIVHRMTIRMKDIARDLGLSVVTVSKVLRDHPDIGEETRKRVLQRVKELDYEPNILARSLVTGRSYLIGLIVPGLIHPFFAEIAKALSKTIVDKRVRSATCWRDGWMRWSSLLQAGIHSCFVACAASRSPLY
jgi:transcriptional regulator with XRE-family HTH domain